MRTNIEIDVELMDRAMAAAGTSTKRDTVEKALELLVRHSDRQEIRKLRGQVRWQGDLDAWRRD